MTLTLEEFKAKVESYYSLVIDSHLSKDDAEDAISAILATFHDGDWEDASDIHHEAWVEYFGQNKYA